MPGPVQTCLFAAALLAAALVAAAPARAEMTDTDKAGMRAFAACLDENGGDEETCVKQLGRFAWYPRNDTTCKVIGARVDRIIGLGGNPVWRDMFQNERCARLGMPHGAAGLPSPPNSAAGKRYQTCQEKSDWLSCLDLVGRHEQNYMELGGCAALANRLNKAGERVYFRWWDRLFDNERCWRLNDAHFDTTTAPPR